MNKHKIIKFIPTFLVFMFAFLVLTSGINYFLISWKIEKENEQQRQDIEQRRKLALSWLNNTDDKFFQENFKNLFVESQKSVLNNMENFIKKLTQITRSSPNDYTKYIDYVKKDSNSSPSGEDKPSCEIAQHRSYDKPWYIRLFDQKRTINYQYGMLRNYKNQDQDLYLKQNECEVFGNFIEHLSTVELNKLMKISDPQVTDADKEVGEENFKLYSEAISNRFLDRNDKISNLIKPYLFYVARIDNIYEEDESIKIEGKILTYPSWNIDTPIDSPNKRPW